MALKTTEKSAGYQPGNAISVVISQPCVWKVETYTDNYDTLQDQFVHVGSDISRVADSIVSSIDANDLENQRKINAGLKKFLQDLRSNRASDPRAVAQRSAGLGCCFRHSFFSVFRRNLLRQTRQA